MFWRLAQVLLALAILASVLLGFALVGGAGLGVVALVDAAMPKPPTAIVYISSPDLPTWRNEMLLSAGLRQSVVLQQVPDQIRRVEIRYQIGGRPLLCDSHELLPKHGESFPAKWEERDSSGTLYQVVPVVLPGRGSAPEFYAANVLLQFCGSDDPFYSSRVYYLGLWYGLSKDVSRAAAEKNGVIVDALRLH